MENLKKMADSILYWAAWAILTMLTGILLAGLVACEQKLSAEKTGKEIDQAVSSASRQLESAAVAAKQEVARAQSALVENAREAGKSLEDTAVTARVKAALIAEPRLKALAIDVSTANGVVTLHGTADSPVSRDNAVQVASNVDGVKSVRNELLVVRGS